MIGKFKDEANGKAITEFVGLRPKMYSFLIEGAGKPVEKHRAKGIKRGAARDITHLNYLKQLEEPAENYFSNHRIGNTLHKIYTIEVTSSKQLHIVRRAMFASPIGINF